jgi:acetoin utilization protein AcuB
VPAVLSLQTSLADAANKELTTLPSTASLQDAISKIVTEEFRRLPIVDQDGYLVGLCNAMDLLTTVYRLFRLSAEKKNHDLFLQALRRSMGELNWQNYISLPPEAPLYEAIGAMWRKGVGVVILLHKGKPTGILTERDIVTKLAREPTLREYASRHMTRDFHKATANAPLREVVEKMVEIGIRRIPIFEGEELIGLLREKDVLLSMSKKLDKLSELDRLLDAPVLGISSAKPPVIYPEASLSYAASLMSEHGLGILMVYDGRRYVGVLTEKDILAALVKRHPHAGLLRLRT